jgi:hypothetical protein
MADNHHLGSRNRSKSLVPISITESDNSRNSCSVGGRQPLGSSVHKLRTLAVSRHNNLGRRALGHRLVDQVVHGSRSRGIATSQKAEDVGGVCNSLDGQAACASDACGQSVEEGRALGVGLADVASLSGTAGVDYGDGAATVVVL